jgi:hypothetical protein
MPLPPLRPGQHRVGSGYRVWVAVDQRGRQRRVGGRVAVSARTAFGEHPVVELPGRIEGGLGFDVRVLEAAEAGQ